jgi:DNA-damage-inducible protein D
MKPDLVARLHSRFEEYARFEEGVAFWLARDLQELLGYAEWRNFQNVIAKAKTACQNAGQTIQDHFVDVNKMVDLGSGSRREIEDVTLTRYACYLIAQNGDPDKTEIAFAQTYFAVQTRKQEIIQQRLDEIERLQARSKLKLSEKELSQVIFERVHDERSFAQIRSKGDCALFGGRTTLQMKQRLGIPESRPLADFLPTITIKAKDFANEITNFNIKKGDLRSEQAISNEHIKNNEDVRKLLTGRGIRPEDLPPSEDAKKVERRLHAEEKKLIPMSRKKAKKKPGPR